MRRRPCQITAEALDFKTPLSLVHSVALARSLRCLHPRVFYIMVSKQSFRCCRRIKAGGRVTGAKGCKLGAYIMKILAAPLLSSCCGNARAKYKAQADEVFPLACAPAALQYLFKTHRAHFSSAANCFLSIILRRFNKSGFSLSK